MSIKVVHVAAPKAKGAVRAYLARESSKRKDKSSDIFLTALGNPFLLHSERDRTKVIAAYLDWLEKKLAERDEGVRGALNRLYLLAKREDVELACFCAPKACHCDVVKEKLEGALASDSSPSKRE
jgi:hypothetical protein